MGRRFWFASLLVAVSAVLLPLVGTWSRRQKLAQCAIDGVAVVPIYGVEVVAANGERRRFCCVRCAEYWLANEPSRPSAIDVTDEVTGQALDASQAYYVRSSVMTNTVTGNRIHVFAEQHDAQGHAAQFRGRLLEGEEHPLRLDRTDSKSDRSP